MRVYISDISVIKDKKYGDLTFKITGKLESGLEIKITDLFYDLQGYIGHYVEMLLCVFRNPYAEYKLGMINQPFLTEKYFSIELIDELKKGKSFDSVDNKKHVILTGEYIDSYDIPKNWSSLMEPKWFKQILKESSVIKTSDGLFLLYPFHMRKKKSIENFPRIVTIVAGRIDLVASRPFLELD